MSGTNGMNGVAVTRRNGTIFVPLPREMWKPIEGTEGCRCPACEKLAPSKIAYWDTMAVGEKQSKGHGDTTWMIHAPELQDGYGAAVYAEERRRDDAERRVAYPVH